MDLATEDDIQEGNDQTLIWNDPPPEPWVAKQVGRDLEAVYDSMGWDYETREGAHINESQEEPDRRLRTAISD